MSEGDFLFCSIPSLCQAYRESEVPKNPRGVATLRITSRLPDFNLWVDYNDDGDIMLCRTEFREYGDSDYIDNLVDEREYNRWYTLAYRLGDID